MNTSEKVNAFAQLGDYIQKLSNEELQEIASKAKSRNGWFCEKNVKNALEGIAYMLNQEKLEKWTSNYVYSEENIPKIVGIVMAGNVPFVGFHDLLCVMMSGNFAAIKPSSSDEFLMRLVVDKLVEIEPRFKKNIEFRDKLTDIDAVIATGSDNTARYFEYYFGKIPHIIRKNRTSIAVLNGDESEEQILALGKDIFDYYGLGCRNVAKVFLPKGYQVEKLLQPFEKFTEVINHHKYRNNYDYQKSIMLVNKMPHLDNGVVLMRESKELVSPISVLNYEFYENKQQIEELITEKIDKIQCVVGAGYIPFGKAQRPELDDYADDIDTMEFLQFSEVEH